MTSGPAKRAQGLHGSAFKYDLLTALGAHGCAGDKHRQRLALRLLVLITARYDWRTDTLTTGQREIAALWSVDERTVKREIAKLREMGWLILKRPATRGRVACHGLGVDAILAETRHAWDAVGPDFVARLTGPMPEVDQTVGQGNVVAFPSPAAEESPAGPWGRIRSDWEATDPAGHAAWIAPLRYEGISEGRLRLRAPSAFHASFVRTHHLAALTARLRRAAPDLDGIDLFV
ncbi:hypothetical protein [Jannaschia aquimarina]|uniref:DnaA N-terminal domain-containing protein n=1 Tax=Jannaschia aquimarina TaxID=935700 RepID=A0A0D1E9P5_9RHOB|nr:hypothetical protein [Jannaschia aquimarina]KIT14399.1 hypothetical protein jaqu_38870 [Jannaschia aquimarina]SNT42181.1 hypothetical protein SAMN05421775_11821 [Jannaschia aquimarina]